MYVGLPKIFALCILQIGPLFISVSDTIEKQLSFLWFEQKKIRQSCWQISRKQTNIMQPLSQFTIYVSLTLAGGAMK